MQINTPNIPKGKAILPYDVVIDFSTSIAAGATGTVTQKIDADSSFFVVAINAVMWTTAVVLTSTIAGTPFPDQAITSPGTTGNTLATSSHFRLQINTAQVDWFSSPARASLICGNGQLPGYLPAIRSIGVGQDIRATLYNDTAGFATFGQVILMGFKLVNAQTAGLGT